MALKDQIALVRDVVILAAVVLFASGWLFSFFYFRNFGISLNGLNLSPQSYYFYSFIPFRYALSFAWPVQWPPAWELVGLGAIVLAVALLYWRLAALRPLWLCLGLLAGIVWLYPVAFYAALDEAQCTRRGGGNLSTFIMVDWSQMPGNDKEGSSAEIAALKEAIAKNSAIVIAETDSALYVLYQPDVVQSRVSGEYRRAPVFRVPTAAVKLTRSNASRLPTTARVPWGGSCNA